MLWLGIYGISLLLAFVFGRIYCGYMCPMNTEMYPAEWISQKLQINTDEMPRFFKSENAAWIFLLLTIGVMIFSKQVLNTNLPILLVWVLVAFLITLCYRPAFTHNFLCPFGPLQKNFGKRSRFTETVAEEDCISCQLCKQTCPADAVTIMPSHAAAIDNRYCHQYQCLYDGGERRIIHCVR